MEPFSIMLMSVAKSPTLCVSRGLKHTSSNGGPSLFSLTCRSVKSQKILKNLNKTLEKTPAEEFNL